MSKLIYKELREMERVYINRLIQLFRSFESKNQTQTENFMLSNYQNQIVKKPKISV